MLASAVAAPAARAAERATLIARVLVNTVNRGDLVVIRDARGHILVSQSDFRQWNLQTEPVAPVLIDGEPHVDVSSIPGLNVTFDAHSVTLRISVAARALPANVMNLGPERRANVVFPAENGFFVNYGLNASGDDSFDQRQYQFATELGIRTGDWLFYNTTTQQWGAGSPNGFVRLLTNAQLDDRPNLRRWTFGDFFTPTFDVNSSVPMAGASLTKFYTMDPYFVQYPTAAFTTELAFPSTVQVRIDGNLVAQRQVQPGPLDITNINNGITGGHSVSVVIRDPFGREQTLAQPFFFATQAGLAQGLHEYSYNLGFVRRLYGIESDNYGDLAASAFHRYAFTNQLTMGLRGQATLDLYNVGPFGTWQSACGIVGAGASVGGRNGSTGGAGSAAYSYTGTNFSVNLGALYRSRDYAQLSDLVSDYRVRSNQYASGSLFFAQLGTLTATYNGISTYEGPDAKITNVTYSRSMLEGKGLLSLNYVRTVEPQSSYGWLLSFRYFFDISTSVVAAVGGSNAGSTQALSLQKTVPQGEGIGYELTAGRFDSDAPDALVGRAFVQANAAHATFGAEYSRASRSDAAPGVSRLFVAGSIGAVGGRIFAARPVQDSFALIRVPELKEIPVYANGWYVGSTDANGEVVATNVAAYYDNFLTFSTKELPIEYVFPTAEIVISPPTRSGTLVQFSVRKNHAVVGTLLGILNGEPVPLEFREIALVRGSSVIKSFTARRGEFYVEGVDPGEYVLRQETGAACVARVVIPAQPDAVTDVGRVECR